MTLIDISMTCNKTLIDISMTSNKTLIDRLC